MQPNTLHSKAAATAQCAVNTHKSTRFQKQLEREEPQSYNQNKQTPSVLSKLKKKNPNKFNNRKRPQQKWLSSQFHQGTKPCKWHKLQQKKIPKVITSHISKNFQKPKRMGKKTTNLFPVIGRRRAERSEEFPLSRSFIDLWLSASNRSAYMFIIRGGEMKKRTLTLNPVGEEKSGARYGCDCDLKNVLNAEEIEREWETRARGETAVLGSQKEAFLFPFSFIFVPSLLMQNQSFCLPMNRLSIWYLLSFAHKANIKFQFLDFIHGVSIKI